MANIDYIETTINKTVHISRAHSNAAFCGAPLIGKIRPRTAVHVNCSGCQQAAR
jgi:hypothetical protein